MGTFAIVENSIVTNIIVWDGNRENWAPPDDAEAVEIQPSDAVHIGESYIDGVFSMPVPTPQAPQDSAAEMLSYMAGVRATREQILNRLAGIGVAAIIGNDTVTSSGVVAARSALLALPSLPSVANAPDLDTLRTAVLAAYRSAAAAAPASVRAAFAAGDA